MEKLATDIYSFETLRTAGYAYVDKTAQILAFVNDSAGRQFFLSRPRRFGKSLLVSTHDELKTNFPESLARIGERRKYTLDFPNLEVADSFLTAGVSFSSEKRTIVEIKTA